MIMTQDIKIRITYQDLVNIKDAEIDQMIKTDIVKNKKYPILITRSKKVRCYESFEEKKDIMVKLNLMNHITDGSYVQILKKYLNLKDKRRIISNKGYWIYRNGQTIINESQIIMYPFLKNTDIDIYQCFYTNGTDKKTGLPIIISAKTFVSQIDIDHIQDKLCNNNGKLQRTEIWINQIAKNIGSFMVQSKKLTQEQLEELIKLARYGYINENEFRVRMNELIKLNKGRF